MKKKLNRDFCTDKEGCNFENPIIEKIWQKGIEVKDKNPAIWRKDKFGTLIKRDKYKDTSSKYGWEIDHSKPVSKGGTDHINNLQPLYWKTNREKSNIYPSFKPN